MLVCKSATQRKALCIPGTPTLSLTVQGYVISRIFGAPDFPPCAVRTGPAQP